LTSQTLITVASMRQPIAPNSSAARVGRRGLILGGVLIVAWCHVIGSSGAALGKEKSCEMGWGCARMNLSVGAVVGNVWQHGEEFLTIP
jgi:hypothetical protein